MIDRHYKIYCLNKADENTLDEDFNNLLKISAESDNPKYSDMVIAYNKIMDFYGDCNLNISKREFHDEVLNHLKNKYIK